MKMIEKDSKLIVNGYPNPFGYAYDGRVIYNIKDAKIPFYKLKEWDFYQITSRKFSFYAVLGHVGYATSINCYLFEFDTKKTISVGKLVPFKKVKLDNNASMDSTVLYKDKNYKMEFRKVGNNRFIEMEAISKIYGKCEVKIKLEETQKDNILVCTPFENKKEFYLNQKICLMKASGFAQFGDNYYEFKEDENFGLLDWGRGVLPFKHHWIWGSGSGIVDGKYFGFNIGSFGINDYGSENIFFYDGKSYKMDKVDISFDEADHMKEWTYHGGNNEFEFTMKPIYDNNSITKVLWVDNNCHQMFGDFNGYIVIDGKKIEIKNFFAFTESAYNRW